MEELCVQQTLSNGIENYRPLGDLMWRCLLVTACIEWIIPIDDVSSLIKTQTEYSCERLLKCFVLLKVFTSREGYLAAVGKTQNDCEMVDGIGFDHVNRRITDAQPAYRD